MKTNFHTIFYDGACDLCVSLREQWGWLLTQRGFEFTPYQEAGENAPFPIGEFRREMKLRMADGRWFGGVDAYLQFFKAIPILRPLALLLRLNAPRRLAERIYRRVAATRHCAEGRCRLPRRMPADRWVPIIALPGIVLLFKNHMTPWVVMWLLALAVFVGCKWLTLRDAMFRQRGVVAHDALLYLFAWPGMNPDEFFNHRARVITREGTPVPWFAFARIVFGAFLLWGIVPVINDLTPLARGWVAMFALVCLLHFGLLDLMAWGCRARGWNARPLMLQPLRSKTIAEFWGLRWNTAFAHLTRHYIFLPTTRWIGPRLAMIVVFLVSGLVHELVITVPAGGGYGLPTLYFAIQAAGLLAEKQILQRPQSNLVIRYAFTWTVVAAPIGLLFPPVFVHNIILPMLQALGIN